jgi:hypothetical protein
MLIFPKRINHRLRIRQHPPLDQFRQEDEGYSEEIKIACL